jgi:hypothetical protein
MPFEMLDVGPRLSEAQVHGLEHQLGIALPESYKSFLLRYNGGRPKPEFFPIDGYDRCSSNAVHYFFGIGWSVQSINVDWNFRIYKGRLPEELLPIAGDGSGNLVCLAIRGARIGVVCFWDHDEEHVPPTYNNVYLIAQTFTNFLESLHFEDLSEEVAKSLGQPEQRRH